MNITIIIADWGKTVNGSQYTMHFSPNSHERNIMFALDELADPASCSYKILLKEDLDETFWIMKHQPTMTNVGRLRHA